MKTAKWISGICFLLLAALLIVHEGCGKKNEVVSISLSPEFPIISKGTNTYHLSATAYFSNGQIIPLWLMVNWYSSDPTVATVDYTSGALTGIASGTTVITAIDISHPNATSSVSLIVTETTLSSIVISMPSSTLAAGDSQQLTATGIYTLPTPSPTLDLTQSVIWSSSSSTVAVISNVSGTRGFLTAVSAGTTTVTAMDPFTSITGTANLTVQ